MTNRKYLRSVVGTCSKFISDRLIKKFIANFCIIFSARPIKRNNYYSTSCGGVARVIGARGGLQFCRPQSCEMPDDPLSPPFLLPPPDCRPEGPPLPLSIRYWKYTLRDPKIQTNGEGH